MTAQLPSKERLEQIANFHRTMSLPPSHAEIEALARYAMAGMEQEPMAVAGFDAATAIRACMDEFPESVHDIVEECAQIAENTISSRHAAPVVSEQPEREQVRLEHAGWSQATFGNVGPVGPLKHLSKEALEAAAEPGDLSEWADMQFLLWDAQRRAGITDEQITQAMIEKLAVNKARRWPEPKDGEPRLHIKEQTAPVADSDKILSDICDLFKIGELARTRSAIMTNIENAINFAEKLHAIELEFFMVPGEPDDDYPDEEPMDECLVNSWGSTTEQYVEQFRMALKKIAPPAPVAVPDELVHHDKDPEITKAYKIGWNACSTAILNHSGGYTEMVNSSVIPAGWKLVPIEPTQEMIDAHIEGVQSGGMQKGYRAMLATAPQPPVSTSGWIKCSDRMPEIMKTVIVAEGEYISYMWWNGEAWDCWDDHGELQDVTHWMPLPAGPKPDGE